MQGTIEQALAAITGEEIHVAGSGRTDAGAHARGQVIAFSTGSSLSPATFRRALNAHLPRDIAVIEAEEVEADFHPRFAATSRVYRYRIWNRPERSPFWGGQAYHVPAPLDAARINEALSTLVGVRDMSAFVPVQTAGPRSREVFAARCDREGDLVTITLEASGFMRQMVRAIVGTAIQVGRGSMTVDEFKYIAQSGQRPLAGDTAPAHGLYLEEVVYPRREGDAKEKQ